ncbi:hypothetical protein L3X38_010201 [Prunus dulcis]|uniref:Uncharacterized protein n=1 Tax=Prunus dulcis TaxID=3755 RepID=A0AAD4WFR8_PRUDU|nr:hypothetical protein L3X38_010201 [Prunus dulcis]
MLEGVASYDTWIWHTFFGATGSNNDVNILACSPLFDDVVHGVAHHVEYIVNGNNTIKAIVGAIFIPQEYSPKITSSSSLLFLPTKQIGVKGPHPGGLGQRPSDA